jgi:hypothetical protein
MRILPVDSRRIFRFSPSRAVPRVQTKAPGYEAGINM